MPYRRELVTAGIIDGEHRERQEVGGLYYKTNRGHLDLTWEWIAKHGVGAIDRACDSTWRRVRRSHPIPAAACVWTNTSTGRACEL